MTALWPCVLCLLYGGSLDNGGKVCMHVGRRTLVVIAVWGPVVTVLCAKASQVLVLQPGFATSQALQPASPITGKIHFLVLPALVVTALYARTDC